MKFTPSVAASNARLACMLGALALSSAIVGGCNSSKSGGMSLNPNDWNNRSIADQPLMLELVGPISVDVGTFAGDVVIEADPDRTNGEVTIVREAIHGFGRSKEGKA